MSLINRGIKMACTFTILAGHLYYLNNRGHPLYSLGRTLSRAQRKVIYVGCLEDVHLR